MTIRLNKVTRDLNVGITTVVEFLQKKGYTIEASPNAKITEEQYAVLVKEFSTDKNLKIESEKFIQERQNKDRNKASISIDGFEHQAGVGVVGQGAQQGEDERTFLAERPARVDAPAEHEGHPLAAHLDVVVVRDVAADLPYDAPPVGGDLPALSAYGNCGQHENASQ